MHDPSKLIAANRRTAADAMSTARYLRGLGASEYASRAVRLARAANRAAIRLIRAQRTVRS